MNGQSDFTAVCLMLEADGCGAARKRYLSASGAVDPDLEGDLVLSGAGHNNLSAAGFFGAEKGLIRLRK